MKGRLLSIVLACVLALLLSAAVCDAQSYIRSGDSQYGPVLYNWNGKELRQGNSRYSEVLFNWDGNYIRKGDSIYSTALYNYDGQYLRKGTNKYSEPLLNVSGTVPIVMLILLILQ